MGVVHTPICGQFVCGDGTLCGTWSVGGDRPALILKGRTVTSGWTPDGVIGRPRIILRGRTVTTDLDTTVAVNRPKLILSGRSVHIQPFVGIRVGRPVLVLSPTAATAPTPLTPSAPQTLILTPTTEEVR